MSTPCPFDREAMEALERSSYSDVEQMEYRDPSVIEVLEAANGLRDPELLGMWMIRRTRKKL
jgi:hypothetical protein